MMNQRLEYIKKLEEQISQAQAVLDRLKAERNQALQQAQHDEIEHLEHYLESAQLRLKDISEAAEEAWEELKKAIEDLLSQINEILQKLMKQ